jgi:site-specific DNA recombinase
MGGTPPLGYEPNGRTLAIVEEHANLVHGIYRRYLAIGNVRLLADANIFSPLHARKSGRLAEKGEVGRPNPGEFRLSGYRIAC